MTFWQKVDHCIAITGAILLLLSPFLALFLYADMTMCARKDVPEYHGFLCRR